MKNGKIIMNSLIKKFEGCKLTAYQCPAGIWTIGYGTTKYPNGIKVKKGDKITEEEAQQFVQHYIDNEITPHLNKHFSGYFNKNQKEALHSLIYNIGWRAFRNSRCFKYLKERDFNSALREWNWFSAGGQLLKGLAQRRIEEIILFMTASY